MEIEGGFCEVSTQVRSIRKIWGSELFVWVRHPPCSPQARRRTQQTQEILTGSCCEEEVHICSRTSITSRCFDDLSISSESKLEHVNFLPLMMRDCKYECEPLAVRLDKLYETRPNAMLKCYEATFGAYFVAAWSNKSDFSCKSFSSR